MLKKIILGIVAILVVLQFFQINKTNPEYPAAQDFMAVTNPPAEVAELLKVACYDCHSYETKYPWYTYVQPVGWWIADHVEHGRGHLNFSEWTTYSGKKAKHKLEESYEEVEEGHMPLTSYPLMHAEARMSDEQRSMLATWFEKQYRTHPGE